MDSKLIIPEQLQCGHIYCQGTAWTLGIGLFLNSSPLSFISEMCYLLNTNTGKFLQIQDQTQNKHFFIEDRKMSNVSSDSSKNDNWV